MQNNLSEEQKEQLMLYYIQRNKTKRILIIFFVFFVILLTAVVSVLCICKNNCIALKKSNVTIEYGETYEFNQEEFIDFSLNHTKKEDIKVDYDIPNEKEKEYPAVGEYEVKIIKKSKIEILKLFKIPYSDEQVVTVTVEDTTPPEIKTPEKIEIIVDTQLKKDDYLYLFEVSDLSETKDIELDTSELDTTLTGEYFIKVSVKDVYNNVATTDVKCTVIDDPYDTATETSPPKIIKTKANTAKITTTQAVNQTYYQTNAETKTISYSTSGTTTSRRISSAVKTKKTTSPTKKVTTTTIKKITTTYAPSNEKQTEILKLVNKKRKAAGLNKLKPLISLDNAARIRAKEIATSFSHTRPNGKGGETVLSDKKIEFTTYVENIGEGNKTAKEIFNVWWNSTSGKANILNPKVKYIGSACYYYPSDPNNFFYYWVQIFYCY